MRVFESFVSMSILKTGLSPEVFYGGTSSRQEEIEAIIKRSNSPKRHQQLKLKTRLLGPSKTWKVFKKQKDAIDCCIRRRNGLMPFAFEDVNGRRMFLAAHPEVFWEMNWHRFFQNCSTYEVIREYSGSKLYLDIEFEHAYNTNKNGDRMLNNLLDVINFNLKDCFNITCTRNEALDLDSSSDVKFSHHVIYEIENVAFQDNYAVGNFVRKICGELRNAYESSLSGDSTKLLEVANKYNLSQDDILELFISDRKGQAKLLIDEGVYTKNRHFRLLGSSKRYKNIPLKISENNKYKPRGKSEPLEYFLDSLVTYFSWKVERILEFTEPAVLKPHRIQKQPRIQTETIESTIYHQIDSFIDSLIFPRGKIRRKVFFSDTSTIVYDIQDFRFCQNINREHKSNNIKYIVDLESLVFYQKCYDPDCADFHSDKKQLPEEICFLFESDSFLTECDEIPDDNIVKVMESMEYEDGCEQSISDEDLLEVADCAETLISINW